MNGMAVLVAVLLSGAGFLMFRPRPSKLRLDLIATRRASRDQSSRAPSGSDESDESVAQARPRLAFFSCVLCGMVAALLLGGLLGIGVGTAIIAVGPLLLGRLESRKSRTHRLALEIAAPTVADLMAACLASGASTAAATRATAEAVGGPVSDLLNQCVVQFNLGASPARVWKPLHDEPSLAPIARAILRSADTGAPLTAVLLRVADDLRMIRRAQLDQAAKTVGVKAVGPLGLCFLPAFMLLGVVPLIASLVMAGISG
ncbi:MAG TPA: hypothetical protein DCQ04_15245 [Actinobacteria bacterium]|nr:hypothetical protein [Actinomycetota bacterium]